MSARSTELGRWLTLAGLDASLGGMLAYNGINTVDELLAHQDLRSLGVRTKDASRLQDAMRREQDAREAETLTQLPAHDYVNIGPLLNRSTSSPVLDQPPALPPRKPVKAAGDMHRRQSTPKDYTPHSPATTRHMNRASSSQHGKTTSRTQPVTSPAYPVTSPADAVTSHADHVPPQTGSLFKDELRNKILDRRERLGMSRDSFLPPEPPPSAATYTSSAQGSRHDPRPESKYDALFEGEDDNPDADDLYVEMFDPIVDLTPLLQTAQQIKSGCPAHYQLQVNEVHTHTEIQVRHVEIGERQMFSPVKSLLMVGETGSGKSTMIDSLLNHILRVKVSSDVRLKLVSMTSEEAIRRSKITDSQTDWVTVYTINPIPGSLVTYTLNVIDTPGFGDTRGMERDKEIVGHIKKFFSDPKKHGVDSLHAVCFLVKSNNNRLTTTMKYVFDAVLGLFGKNLKDNIYILCSHSDGSKPQVLESLNNAHVPYVRSFNMNNGWMDENRDNVFTKGHYDMTTYSFDELLSCLLEAEAKSLTMSATVLRERAMLEEAVEGLQNMVCTSTGKLVTIKNSKDLLRERSVKSMEIPEWKKYKILTQDHKNLNCPACNVTCRIKCQKIEQFIEAKMRKNVKCKMCNCLAKNHRLQRFKIENRYEMVKKSFKEVEDQYGKEGRSLDAMMDAMDREADKLMGDIKEVLSKMKVSLDSLNSMALKPEVQSTVQYIELVIAKEERELKPGSQKRISMLRKLQNNNILLQDIARPDFDVEEFISTQL